MSAADRIHGALLGTLLGDAFGRPFEGIARGDGRLHDAVRDRAAHPRGWDHSDDGEMALAVAESITTRGAVDEGHLLATLAARHEPARGYGKGMRAAFRALETTGDWRAAPHALWAEGSRGNGATVRVAAVAAWHVNEDDPAVVARAAARSAAPTHAHPDAVHATRAMALALWHLMRGGSAAGLRAWLYRADPSFAPLLKPRSTGGTFAKESLAAAVTVMSCDPGLVDAVHMAVRLGGDTDTNAAMAGALAGAAHGRAAIPADWVAALPPVAVRRTAELARRLAETPHARGDGWVTAVHSVPTSVGEDRVWSEVDGDAGWIVVADGAGGTGRGAEAAKLVVERVRASRPTSGRAIVHLLEAIDGELSVRASGLTTAVVARLDGSRVIGASVGDSVAWALGASCEELTAHQLRRPLIGSGRAQPVPFVLSRVRRVLVATDGVSEHLSPDGPASLLSAGATARMVVDAARLPSGALQDDATAVVAELCS